MSTSKTLLCIGFVFPEPKSSAAGTRIIQLLKLFLEQGYDITFGTTAKPSENAVDLSKLGIYVESIELNNDSFDSFITTLNPSVVLFDRFMTEEQFGWRVSQCCPKAVKILDTEDLHFLRQSRQKNIENKVDFSIDFIKSDIAKREIASIYRCDLTLIISEVEFEILSNKLQIDPSLLLYIPFIFTSGNDALVSKLSFDERKDFIFIGNFLHAPNVSAVNHLKYQIWPQLSKAIPKALLHIYGAYAKPKQLSLSNEKDRFYVHGFVENAHTVIESSRVMLAPLQFGAGLKGKIFDALLNGTPCVMSSIAAEGIFGQDQPNGFINDDNQKFIDNAIDLYTKISSWEQSQSNGFEILKKRFNSQLFTEQLFKRVAYLYKNLEAHRLQNFTGILLQHHSMQSTKYLSKWIQAKQTNND